MKRSTIFFALLIISAAPPALSAEIRYTGGSGRDPFAAPFEQKKIGDDANSNEKKLRSLVVQGIVSSAANPRAIINGKIDRVGSELMPGVKITRIVKGGVFVNAADKEIVLSRPTAQPTKGKNIQ